MTDRILTPGLTISAFAAVCGLIFIVLFGGQAGAFGGGEERQVAPTVPLQQAPGAAQPAAAPQPEVVAVRQPAYRYPHEPVPSVARRPVNGPSHAIARIRRGARVALRATTGGRVIATVGSRSEFGGSSVLGVVRRQGSWLAVLSPALPNSTYAWVHLDSRIELYWTKYSLHADLSRRALEVRYGDRVLARFLVTVGASGSETPIGRYAITDALTYPDNSFYGCCVAALSGHQPNPPAGWIGGDRIAIHGTPGEVGYAGSAGCLRATDQALRYLFSRVPLGTPVFIRR